MTELPDGWSVATLGEVAAFSPRAPQPVEGVDPDVTFLPMAAVQEVSGRLDLSQVISASEGKRKNLTHMEDGDVIFAKITPCMENGKIAVVNGLVGGRAYGSTEFHVLRPNGSVDRRYLWYFLVRDDFRWEAERAMTGAVGQRRVPRKYLQACSIPSPTAAEQAEIVRILDMQLARLDTVLEAVQAVRDRADQLRRSLLHAAFTGQLTHPDPRRMAEMPEVWEKKELSEVAELINGDRGKNYPSKSTLVNEGPLFINAGHLSGGRVDALQASHITQEHYERLSQGKIARNDVLFCIRGSLGKCGLVDFDEPGAIASSLVIVRATSVDHRFLFWFLQSPQSAEQILRFDNGTAQPNLAARDLGRFEVPLPDLHEQETSVKILETQFARLDKALGVADRVEAECARLRRSLLQAAFTGELTRKWREASG